MGKKLSQIQELRTDFQSFKKEAIRILEALNDYNSEKDTLGTERVKSEEIRKRINLLK
jgi:hypothetical protein